MAELSIHIHYIRGLLSSETCVRCFFLQGVLLSTPETVEDPRSIKRLWFHEVYRVYYDRLVDDADHEWLYSYMQGTVKKYLHEDFHQLFAHLDHDSDGKVTDDNLRSLLYCDFSNPKSDKHDYVEVQDMENLRKTVEGYLEEFNNMSKKPMNLVLFILLNLIGIL